MAGFVLKRTDQGGGYVAIPGHASSYTHNIRFMRVFLTREAADAERCKENEVIVSLDSLIPVPYTSTGFY